MTNSVKVWRPDQSEPHSQVLTVPYSGSQRMTRSLYESLLESRLRELIDKNPKRAKEILTGTEEHNPDLYRVAMDSEPRDWPPNIVACDQMQMLLNQINWNGEGRVLHLSPSELPDLEAIAAALP